MKDIQRNETDTFLVHSLVDGKLNKCGNCTNRMQVYFNECRVPSTDSSILLLISLSHCACSDIVVASNVSYLSRHNDCDCLKDVYYEL